jgi:peptidoglycan/xylan/chitin deacetylase (PgdA/CDA1 family)
MRLFRPGFLAGCLYPEAIFRIETTEKKLYLTFDDGPDPDSTNQLLGILKKHDIKACFFCTGMSAEKNPVLITQIRNDGHFIGNHGYNHFDGWRTDSLKYIKDVTRASYFTSDKVFRPPFGRLSIKQYKKLRVLYKLIFWDLMAYDFDITFGSDKSLGILKDKMRPGSIIVLHDSVSSCTNKILEEFLTFAVDSGYQFELIDAKI